MAVVAFVVFLLLILIYRSPVFWAIPFFTVILAEASSRGFGYLLADPSVVEEIKRRAATNPTEE